VKWLRTNINVLSAYYKWLKHVLFPQSIPLKNPIVALVNRTDIPLITMSNINGKRAIHAPQHHIKLDCWTLIMIANIDPEMHSTKKKKKNYFNLF
jgi:hypothetical protein